MLFLSRPVMTYFNPRSPCGERHDEASDKLKNIEFQSTLPVWGATYEYKLFRVFRKFQSTLPVWGATCAACCPRRIRTISIHAPRVGSDSKDA